MAVATRFSYKVILLENRSTLCGVVYCLTTTAGDNDAVRQVWKFRQYE